ncbi:MAG: endonuclease III, partial [Elusimicrobia bacterium RIFOXYD12_FULL_66_9]
MIRVERAKKIVASLRKLYPRAKCELDHANAHELLFATILSAQCTDVRVNKVAKTLFSRFKTVADYARADALVLESIIHSCGFYRSKAKSIIETARAIIDRFGGEVPAEMDQLLTLRGVARKTANVVLGNAFGKAEGVVVDTHMKRLAYRMGLTDETDPVEVERDLMACVPKKDWIYFSHAM